VGGYGPFVGSTAAPGRERILHASLRLFGEQGFDGTSVRQVAAAAGVSAPLILHHFGSKDGLRKAVAVEVMARVEAALDAALVDFPAEVQVDALTERLVSTMGQVVRDANLRDYVRRALLEGDGTGGVLLRQAWEIAAKEVERARAAGALREDIDIQETRLHLLLLVLGPWLLPGLDDLLEAPAYSTEGIARRMHAHVALLTHGVARHESA
jgi:TetR/AcrR family transcriptional regulator, regulator of cefoperazone and chloramphenicol sensitivity